MSKRALPKAPVNARPGVRTEVSDVVARRWNPDIHATTIQANGENSISVLEPIGEDWFGGGVTAKRIAAALRAIGDKDVVVNINSPGGDFFEGLAIYNLLREHPGKVTVKVLGMAASAASIIAMAGDEVLVAQAAFLMIHNTWVLAAGDRHALREVADWLEPFDAAAIDIYHARTGIKSADLANMLDKETWINGTAAVDQGFADDLLSSDEVEADPKNDANLTPIAAQKKLELHLARAGVPRSERRKLFADLKGGKLSAAPSGKPGAAITECLQGLLADLKTL